MAERKLQINAHWARDSNRLTRWTDSAETPVCICGLDCVVAYCS